MGSLAASTVVIAIASAGGRQLGSQLGAQLGGREIASSSHQTVHANLPNIDRLSEISAALRQLADLVDTGQVEIKQEVQTAIEQLLGVNSTSSDNEQTQ